MNRRCEVTVIIPAYNCAQTVERALHSVITQTLVPEQVIVVNDASTDETAMVLNRIQNQLLPFSLLILDAGKNLGPGFSRNLGWDLARTKWIAFLDADDAWHSRKLELQLKKLSEIPTLDLICTQTYLMKSSTSSPIVNEESSVTRIRLNGMFFRNAVATRSVVMRRSISNRFRQGLSEDYGLWLDCLDSGLNFARLEAPLAFHYRPEFSPGGLSSQLLTHEHFELRNFCRFAKRKPILVFVASIFSVVKFLKRVIVMFLRRAIE